jgi:tripartite-type tricarboxylate transporter receptor subunit TctC
LSPRRERDAAKALDTAVRRSHTRASDCALRADASEHAMTRPHRRQFVHLAAGAAALSVLLAFPAHRAWPQAARTIRLVVPYPPGGGIDSMARITAEEVGRAQGVVVVVENRPGAGTVIGTEAVSRAKPDGNTLLITLNTFLVAAHTHKLSYDPLTSFEPICMTGRTPPVIVVDARSPYRTLDDLIRAARAKPGELTYAQVTGASLMAGFERLNRDAEMKMTFVPFAGTAASVTAVLGGHVTATMVDYPAAAGQLQAGSLRALATASGTRMEWVPQVPTLIELGYKELDLDLWYGLFAPKGTPKALIDQLADWFTTAVNRPEVRSKLFAQGIKAGGQCGAPFAAFLRKQYDDYGRIIREANIRAE